MKSLGQVAYERRNRGDADAPEWDAMPAPLQHRWKITVDAVLIHLNGNAELLDLLPAVRRLRAQVAEHAQAVTDACHGWAEEIDRCQELARVIAAVDADNAALAAENERLNEIVTCLAADAAARYETAAPDGTALLAALRAKEEP